MNINIDVNILQIVIVICFTHILSKIIDKVDSSKRPLEETSKDNKMLI